MSLVKHNRSCDYQSLIRVTAVYNNKERTIAGTLIGGNKPRITEVQNISVEANFSQYMIYISAHSQLGNAYRQYFSICKFRESDSERPRICPRP